MSQWFHRNPFKASGNPNFDLGPVAADISSRMYLNYMEERRSTLIRCLSDLTCTRASVVEAANQYISFLLGFSTSPDSGDAMADALGGDKEEDDDNENDEEETAEPGANDETARTKKEEKELKKKEREAKKAQKAEAIAAQAKKMQSLRRLVEYTWTDSLDVKHKSPVSLRDANFELIGVCYNLAFWFSKHAAKVAASSNIETEQAVDVYKSLRNAAGLFEHIKKVLLPQMSGKIEKGSDLDPIVLESYILQSLAEAQEVTIARAIELKHDPGIIAALASETAVLYEKCKFGLQNMPENLVSKWRAYCIFKAACFRAYAHVFFAESELKADRCGIAIASAKEALKYCTQAQNAARIYRSGSGSEFHFLNRLNPLAQRTLSKAETQNAMIYRQKAPTSMPQLQLKATYGIATPELPEGLNFVVDESWDQAVLGFDTSKVGTWISMKGYKDKRKQAQKLHPIPEQPIYAGDRDPNNISGCVIS